jgi:hypothetical protein
MHPMIEKFGGPSGVYLAVFALYLPVNGPFEPD